MKKKISIILVIVVTILCIFLGIRTRYKAKIIITQLSGTGNGYVLETSKNNLIIIDGGTAEDANRLEEIIEEKGNGNVLAWFITSPVSNSTGALLEILENNPEITINQICSSLNTDKFYEETDLSQAEINHVQELMEVLYNDENAAKYVDLQKRGRYAFDNYYFTPLEIRYPDSTEIANQTVVLKIDNSFKSTVFFGNIGEEESHYFYENNKDQLENELIQISTNMENSISDELLNNLKTERIMISGENKFTTDVEIISNDEEKTVEIW